MMLCSHMNNYKSLQKFKKMKTTILKIFLSLFTVIMMLSCTNSQGKDVSKDPKYSEIYHQFFFPIQTLYFYHYTNPNGKSGKFLSVESAVPNAKLMEEIQPGKSRLIVTKIIEVEANNGKTETLIQGKLHKTELSKGLDFLAIWEDVKRGLRK